MAELSSVDAALFAFRKRETRFVLTKAAVAYVLLSAVIGGIVLAISWPTVRGVAAWYLETIGTISHGGEPDLPPREMLIHLVPVGLGAGLVGLVLLAAFEAACLRWLVRGEQGGGLLGLNAGADTWRVFGLYWIWLLACIAASCCVALFYVALRFFGGLHPIAQTIGIIIGVLAPLAIAALMLFFSVRLSPAAAETIRQGKLTFLGAWSHTRGRFWNLLGAFVLLLAGYLLIEMIVGGVLGIPINQALQTTMFELMNGSSGAAALGRLQQALFTPLNIAVLVVYTIALRALALVFVVAWYGVNASAVREETPAA